LLAIDELLLLLLLLMHTADGSMFFGVDLMAMIQSLQYARRWIFKLAIFWSKDLPCVEILCGQLPTAAGSFSTGRN
jgi:hypothetical protein